MRTLLLILLITITASYFAYGQQASLKVTIENIKNQKGSIRVGLFVNENDFLKKVAYGKIVKIDGDEMTVLFENLPSGDYGISVIHDENENGELDTNKLGIPKEGFAFGNNAMGAMGPPSFDKSKVSLKDNPVQQTIKLKYF